MLPIRCFTCNKIIGMLHYIKEFDEETFKKNNIHRFCCKKTILNHVDVSQYSYIKPKVTKCKIIEELQETRLAIGR